MKISLKNSKIKIQKKIRKNSTLSDIVLLGTIFLYK